MRRNGATALAPRQQTQICLTFGAHMIMLTVAMLTHLTSCIVAMPLPRLCN